jgi:dTDP-4-amino-4,6-dideoxygalactose transaminase
MPAAPGGPARDDSLWRLWSADSAHASAFANARSALAALLAARAPRRIWLPAYACPALADAAAAVAAETRFYGVDQALEPDTAALTRQLGPRDAVVVVDYFGRPPGLAWRSLAGAFPELLWIEDRAQAMATAAPPFGSVRLFSPRKLVGVGDGGLLFGDSPFSAPDDDALDSWAPEDARARDPDGRAPETWRGLYRQREALHTVDSRRASERTLDALAALPAAPIAQARRANWRVLANALDDYALWGDPAPAFAPLAFPILVSDAARAVERLAQARIWAPRHWADPPSPAADFPQAHWLAAHCVSLPLDQRYDGSDMARVAAAVREADSPAAR